MAMMTESHLDFLEPTLSLESTLQELQLHNFQVDSNCLGSEVSQVFEQNPLLPGVILVDCGELIGSISRRRFLEQMSRPYGVELFSKRPLKVLYNFTKSETLILLGGTSIVAATRQSLARSLELIYEPIIVQIEPSVYRLLDVHQLLVAQAKIHELTTQLLHEQTQAQMIQTEKMASLGRMVAGVAHEILNPVNFIWGNLGYLSRYSQDLIRLVSTYDQEIAQVSLDSTLVQQEKAEIEFDFLLQDLPQVIDSMRMGAERLKRIVGGLRSFSHMDEAKLRATDVHECIDNTLLILGNRLKYGVEVVKNYGDLPLINCYPGQLSQVFMNLISNAIDALAEKTDNTTNEQKLNGILAKQPVTTNSWQPQIKISTAVFRIESSASLKSDDWVVIQIVDNGCGIPSEIQARIFENFFTTKPVGQGTGLGLAISHQIVTEKHQGQLSLRSQPGVGTEFEIRLPIVSTP
ncbi:ATP-binding protein [Trichocoleus sp. FACHB-262]|nr:ATP-binding protein [Trichocoleus sp. FACHB-262]